MRFKRYFDATGRSGLRHVWLVLLPFLFAACSTVPPSNVNAKSNARLTPSSRVTFDLTQLPEPKSRIAVAVYGFRDQTGQFKPSPDSSYSTSVTQGAASMLVKALKDSGWYIPVEREGLQNLLTERKIVRAIESPSDKGKSLINLPNLLPASLIFDGGVIAFESNVRTGGKGASYLGIGASTQYRVDQVTVGLRDIDVRTGQVLNSVSVTKTIYSYQFSASIYKFTSYQALLQGETGYTTNEPAQLAVREAIESAVIHLTVQGIRDRILELRDGQALYSPIIQAYLAETIKNVRDDGNPETELIPMRPIAQDNQTSPIQPLLPTIVETMSTKGVALSAATESVEQVVAPSVQAAQAEPRPGVNNPNAPLPSVQQPVAPASVEAIAPQSVKAPPVAKTAPVTPVAPAASASARPAKKQPVLSDDIFKQYWRNQQ